MLKHGYGGRVLRIDLTEQRFQIESLNKTWIRPVIGGRAANTQRLFEELDTDCDPLGPDNILIYGVGPLTGSLLPASAYYTVSAKSPLTGILGDSAAGGQFAAEMKLTGFDQIIITGQAESLLYLFVTESGVEFVSCPEYAGKTVIETTQSIRKERKDYSIQVAADKGNVPGFQRHIGAGPDSHAYVRLSQCRSVVDTITHHGNNLSLILKLFNLGRFILG